MICIVFNTNTVLKIDRSSVLQLYWLIGYSKHKYRAQQDGTAGKPCLGSNAGQGQVLPKCQLGLRMAHAGGVRANGVRPTMTTTMTAVEFTAFLVLATAMSFTPGPNTTMAAALGANWGLKPAMRFVWAVPVGWCALLLLCASGVGAVVMAMPALKGAIKAVGIAYLLWLAYKLSSSGKLAESQQQSIIGFWQGVGLQFVNVKAWLLALAIVAGWVVGFDDPLMRLAVVVPVMLFYAFASNFLYASVGALLRSWLAQGQRLLWFNRLMALVLVLTAIWMVKA